MDPQQPYASAVRVEGSRIAAVGNLQAEADECIDLKGAFVLPGLWDTHIHLTLWAENFGHLDLTGCADKAELLARVKQRAASLPPGEWLRGHGWSEDEWLDQALPSADELETGGRPVALTRSDMHSALVNHAALRLAGVTADTQDPEGGSFERDATGRFTGRILDMAMYRVGEVMPEVSDEQEEAGLREACRLLHKWGITGVCDQRLKDAGEGLDCLALYQELQLPLRIHCNLTLEEEDLPAFASGDESVRAGHLKFFADGSLGSRTARMREPYLHGNQLGLWLTEPDELVEGFRKTHERGYPISCHAIGDAAVGAVLDDLLDDRHIAERWLGERARGYYRLRSLAEKGVRLAFGSDAPIADANPWRGIRAAVERRGADGESSWLPDECLDREAALRAYTVDAARSLGWTDTGQLVPGALADLVVLDRDPRTENDPRVLRTVLGGETVYQCS
jgi:predicted amidohydrolase YtcJ